MKKEKQADTGQKQKALYSEQNVSQCSDGGEARSLLNREGGGLSSIFDRPNSPNRYILWYKRKEDQTRYLIHK